MSCASKTRASNSCWAKQSWRRQRCVSSRRETSKPGAPARGCQPPGWSGVFSAPCTGALPGCPGQRIAAPARCPMPGLVVAVSGSVCQFRVCSCVLGHCTRSVGNAPLLFGCSAPYRVQCPLSGAVPLIGCSAPYRVQCPLSGAAPHIGCSAPYRVQCPRRTQLCIEELRVRPIGPSCHAPAQNDEEGITQRPAAQWQPGA